MKRILAVICSAALILSLSAAAFAADGEPDLEVGLTKKVERSKLNSAYGGVDLDELVREGVISQEVSDSINAYLAEKAQTAQPEAQAPDATEQMPGQNGQRHGMKGRQSQMNEQQPPMNGQQPPMNGQESGRGGRPSGMNKHGSGTEFQPSQPEPQAP